jgi:hypothetical protein
MRRQLATILMLFILFIQVFSLVSWTSIAKNLFNSNEVSFDLSNSIVDEEAEEEVIEINNWQDYTFNTTHDFVQIVQINQQVQYLHHSEELKEGFIQIHYTPPNFS